MGGDQTSAPPNHGQGDGKSARCAFTPRSHYLIRGADERKDARRDFAVLSAETAITADAPRRFRPSRFKDSNLNGGIFARRHLIFLTIERINAQEFAADSPRLGLVRLSSIRTEPAESSGIGIRLAKRSAASAARRFAPSDAARLNSLVVGELIQNRSGFKKPSRTSENDR